MALIKILDSDKGSFPAQDVKASSYAKIRQRDGGCKNYNLKVAIAALRIVSEDEADAVFDLELRDESCFRGQAPKKFVKNLARYQHGHGVLPASYSFARPPTAKENFTAGIIGFAVIGVLLYSYVSWIKSPSAPPSLESLRGYAVVYCQMHVKDSLKAPRTAKFPWGVQATALGSDEFIVVSYVDAQNSFGALMRTNYACQIKHTGGDPESWTVQDFRILP